MLLLPSGIEHHDENLSYQILVVIVVMPHLGTRPTGGSSMVPEPRGTKHCSIAAKPGAWADIVSRLKEEAGPGAGLERTDTDTTHPLVLLRLFVLLVFISFSLQYPVLFMNFQLSE